MIYKAKLLSHLYTICPPRGISFLNKKDRKVPSKKYELIVYKASRV